MSKAILVMDMPNECTECPAHFLDIPDNNTVMLWCGCKCKKIELDENNKIQNGYKPEWCPLKPLPEKQEISKYFGSCMNQCCTEYEKGYNACINDILGENI